MNFTYEENERNVPLETYEWDNVWWEHADDEVSPRVLYIGDSISCGIRSPLNSILGRELYIDGFGTSKAVDNPYFKAAISNFGKQSRRVKAVLFNSGLHGWHLTTDEYAEHYEGMIKFMLEEFSGTRLVLLSTTPTREEGRGEKVIERNTKMLELAEKYSLDVIDLYTLSQGLEQRGDGVHFLPESYKALAEKIAERLKVLIAL